MEKSVGCDCTETPRVRRCHPAGAVPVRLYRCVPLSLMPPSDWIGRPLKYRACCVEYTTRRQCLCYCASRGRYPLPPYSSSSLLLLSSLLLFYWDVNFCACFVSVLGALRPRQVGVAVEADGRRLQGPGLARLCEYEGGTPRWHPATPPRPARGGSASRWTRPDGPSHDMPPCNKGLSFSRTPVTDGHVACSYCGPRNR